MKHVPVESSSITSVAFEPDAGNPGTGTLGVRFANGREYHAAGVSTEDHQAMMTAASHGRHFNTVLKAKYTFTKQE